MKVAKTWKEQERNLYLVMGTWDCYINIGVAAAYIKISPMTTDGQMF